MGKNRKKIVPCQNPRAGYKNLPTDVKFYEDYFKNKKTGCQR